ncbi:MAG: amidohydrolase [Pseudomonadota bacterium]
MRHLISGAIAMIALGACEAPSSTASKPPIRPADAIYFGGRIYTGIENQRIDAVAVADGEILAVGPRADVEAFRADDTMDVDLGGATMFPGFVDAHAHLIGIGFRELELNLEGVASIAALVEIIAGEVAKAASGDTIYGRGWIETGWPEGRMPTRDDLDAVSPDNPVILTRADGHAAVVNSAALVASGVDADGATPDPDGGRIDRDADGRATGILIDNAENLVAGLIADPSLARKREAYAVASDVYAAYGWTGLHNMSVDPANLDIIETAAAEGELDIRVYNALNPSGLDLLSTSGPRTAAAGRIITRAIKMYVDGALGSRGAALSEPYHDAPETDGLLLLNEETALPALTAALKSGVQVNTHAIGDRGNRLLLDWYERAFDAVPVEERALAAPRWRIEHAQVLHVQDIPRFADLGVIASMQPSHAIGDLHFAPARLGPSRLDGAYAWRSLIDAGAIVAGGSDAPVERGDPLIEFYAAVARRDLKGYQGDDWRPEEAVTRAEALKMFTAWPAYASFQENNLGTIEVGKRADFTAFQKDIMTINVAEIPGAKAVLTVVDGAIVFDGRMTANAASTDVEPSGHEQSSRE